MQLPDFSEFAPFNELREKMGTDKLGYFELFDPKYHLTGDERSDLDRRGLSISMGQLHHLLDFTLVYKNSRVFIEDRTCYHVAFCSDLNISLNQVRIGTSDKALSKPLPVCQACLQKLHYKGYDKMKARKEAYSRQVLEKFSLESFGLTYHLYPVSEKRELRKSLNE